MRLQSAFVSQLHARDDGRARTPLRAVAEADPEGTASYIADLSEQLAKMAKAAKLDLPAYLLDMACFEARCCSGEGRDRA